MSDPLTVISALNPKARPQALRIGSEGEPIVIIDDFFLNPGAIVDFVASEVTFGAPGHAYPGLRAPVPELLNHALVYGLHPVFELVFGAREADGLGLESSFSMVTARPSRDRVEQLLPHFDNSHPKALATVTYLCDPRLGGTSFYRHRSTRFETVTPARERDYAAALDTEVKAVVLPESYPDAGHPLFERFHTVEPRFNRLVLYRSRLLHSGDIRGEHPLSDDPRSGRLTITSFLRPA